MMNEISLFCPEVQTQCRPAMPLAQKIHFYVQDAILVQMLMQD